MENHKKNFWQNANWFFNRKNYVNEWNEHLCCCFFFLFFVVVFFFFSALRCFYVKPTGEPMCWFARTHLIHFLFDLCFIDVIPSRREWNVVRDRRRIVCQHCNRVNMSTINMMWLCIISPSMWHSVNKSPSFVQTPFILCTFTFLWISWTANMYIFGRVWFSFTSFIQINYKTSTQTDATHIDKEMKRRKVTSNEYRLHCKDF